MSEFEIKLKLKEREKKTGQNIKGKKRQISCCLWDKTHCYTALRVSNVVVYGSEGVGFHHWGVKMCKWRWPTLAYRFHVAHLWWCSWCVHIFITALCSDLAEVTPGLICWCDWSVGEEYFKVQRSQNFSVCDNFPNNKNKTVPQRWPVVHFSPVNWGGWGCFCPIIMNLCESQWKTVFGWILL